MKDLGYLLASSSGSVVSLCFPISKAPGSIPMESLTKTKPMRWNGIYIFFFMLNKKWNLLVCLQPPTHLYTLKHMALDHLRTNKASQESNSQFRTYKMRGLTQLSITKRPPHVVWMVYYYVGGGLFDHYNQTLRKINK